MTRTQLEDIPSGMHLRGQEAPGRSWWVENRLEGQVLAATQRLVDSWGRPEAFGAEHAVTPKGAGWLWLLSL